MPNYQIFYRYEESGKGKARIKADSLDKCKQKFEDSEFTHDCEEIEDSEQSIKAILNLDTGKFEYSELDEISELQEKQSAGFDDEPFDEDTIGKEE